MPAPVVWLHFNRLRAKRGARDLWTVRTGGVNRYVRKVHVRVPLETIYRGYTARQPRAYLKGRGFVTIRDGVATIVQSV